jgi:hypothetical protein
MLRHVLPPHTDDIEQDRGLEIVHDISTSPDASTCRYDLSAHLGNNRVI